MSLCNIYLIFCVLDDSEAEVADEQPVPMSTDNSEASSGQPDKRTSKKRMSELDQFWNIELY